MPCAGGVTTDSVSALPSASLHESGTAVAVPNGTFVLTSEHDGAVLPGSGVLIVNVTAEDLPVCPASSDCSACAVYVPGASAGETVADHAPTERVTVSVRTGAPEADPPLYTFTVTCGPSPATFPAAPESAGRSPPSSCRSPAT